MASPEVLPESLLRVAGDLLVRLVEAAGALVIFVGAAWAFVQFVRVGLPRHLDGRAGARRAFVAIRLSLGRFLALGLDFQLADTYCAQPSRRASPISVSSPQCSRPAGRTCR